MKDMNDKEIRSVKCENSKLNMLSSKSLHLFEVLRDDTVHNSRSKLA